MVNKINNKVSKLRKDKGLTQEELADKLKISRQSLIAIEKGDCSPSLCTAFKISRYFGMKIDEIFDME